MQMVLLYSVHLDITHMIMLHNEKHQRNPHTSPAPLYQMDKRDYGIKKSITWQKLLNN